MNLPMQRHGDNIKTIYGKAKGLVVPDRIKKLLVGAEIKWDDKEPLSQDATDNLHFYFDSKTTAMTDLLLKKIGITDVSQYVNISFLWDIEVQLWYNMLNSKTKVAHIDHHYFTFRGTIFPMTEKFKKERDNFYLMKNLEHELVPEENKNKGYYYNTLFIAKVKGI